MDECVKEGKRRVHLRQLPHCRSKWEGKESVEECIKCLTKMHKENGMTEEFVHLFEEIYVAELKKGTLPREEGEWQDVRIGQVLHNLGQACRNNDRSHFSWFMYMMMRFVLKEKMRRKGKGSAGKSQQRTKKNPGG